MAMLGPRPRDNDTGDGRSETRYPRPGTRCTQDWARCVGDRDTERDTERDT